MIQINLRNCSAEQQAEIEIVLKWLKLEYEIFELRSNL